MSTYRELDITVIYAEGGSKPSSARGRPAFAGQSSTGWRWWGCLLMLLAGAWMYGTWYPAAHALRGNLIETLFNLPGLVDISALFASRPPPPELANPAQPEKESATGGPSTGQAAEPTGEPAAEAGPSLPEQDEQAAQSRKTVNRLTVATYVWIGIMTFVGCWLALAGGTWLAGRFVSWHRARWRLGTGALVAIVGIAAWYWRKPDDFPPLMQVCHVAAFALLGAVLAGGLSHRRAWLGVLLTGLALVVYGLAVNMLYGWSFPLRAGETFWLGTMLWSAVLGAALARHGRSVQTAAVVFTLAAGGLTIIGLWYGTGHDWFMGLEPTASTYAKVAGPQLACGLILLGGRWALR